MSTTPPRNVIYCNDPGFLPGIVGTPYTDVILNFLAPDGHGNLTGPAPDPADVRALQNVGQNVLISLGGDEGTFPSSAWQQYAQDVNVLVNQVVAFVTANGLNGVDIDYEDDAGFIASDGGPPNYPGVQLLIDLTNGLAQSLPQGSIITHAPQAPYFDPDGGFNAPGGTAPYTQIFQAAGDKISWFNCQFYNNPAYDKSADTKVSWYRQFAEAIGAPKLLVGTPVAAHAATSGYLSDDDFTSGVIAPLRQQFPGAFGGVTGWAYIYNQGSDWPDGIARALHDQHVFYWGYDNNVHHVYWDPATGQVNRDQWTNDGSVAGNPATLLDGASQHVFYRGTDSNVHHVYWDPASGINADQWTHDGSVAGNVATLLGGGGAAGPQQHVFYRGYDNNVHHAYWDPASGQINHDQWTHDGSVFLDVATLLDGASQHVFYMGTDKNVHHVYWAPAAGINADQWTHDGSVFLDVSAFLDGGQQHVFYTGTDYNVHHVYWDRVAGINAEQWTHDGQVVGPVTTLLAGTQQHVFYQGEDSNVHHIYWDPAAGINADQWTYDGQARGNQATLLDGTSQHVFYRALDGNVHHVYWDPAAGINADQWTTDGQVNWVATLLTG